MPRRRNKPKTAASSNTDIIPHSTSTRPDPTSERERLCKLASKALASSGKAVAALLLAERSAFEQYAPGTLAQLRLSRDRFEQPDSSAETEAKEDAAQLVQQLAIHSGDVSRCSIRIGDRLTLTTPVWTVAPMVGQCDLPFRLLTRRHGARLVYSEMLMADEFVASAKYRQIGLGLGSGPLPEGDHPLIVQFAVNDPAILLRAAVIAQNECGADAVDINLGCPQNRAREGHYGSFLHDPCDWDLVCSMVRVCATSSALHIPVTCKIRLQPTVESTIEFCKRLEAAGAALIAVHGRQRGDEKHRRSGAADLEAIREIKSALRIPVLSNGNVSSYADAIRALHITGCDGVMSAEEILRDPALFERCERCLEQLVTHDDDQKEASEGGHASAHEASADMANPDVVGLASEYVSLCELHPPSSVWTVGSRDEEGPGEVAKQHLTRMLRFQHGARDVLSEHAFLTARSVTQIAKAFRAGSGLRRDPHLVPLEAGLQMVS